MREENVARIRELAAALAANRDEAAKQAGELLALPPDAWDGWLAAHPEAATLHLLQALLDAAGTRTDRVPAISQFVVRHAGAVSVPAEAEVLRVFVRAHAWRIEGDALRAARDFRCALHAYQRSLALFATPPVLPGELEAVERAVAALQHESEAMDGVLGPTEAVRSPDAGGIVARLLRETAAADWPQLAARTELHDVSALDQLSRQAMARIHRVPLESLAITSLALGVVEQLPETLCPPKLRAQLRSQAWKDQANVFRFLGRYSDAFAAYDRAEESLDAFSIFDLGRAGVWLGRSAVLQESGRVEEAMPLLRDCERLFEQHGDRRGVLYCGISEGALLHRSARYREACDLYLSLIPLAREVGDPGALASIHNNIGHSAIEIEELSLADAHLTRAVELFRETHEPLQIARSELAQGRMFLRRGETERGMAQLQRVRAVFLEHGLVEEAGLCGLDLVKALLAREAFEEAEALARGLVSEFTAAQLNRRAITALAFLSEAISQRTASVATVQNVRRFIRRLRSDPDTEFVAA
jgi:tetratricopeptide (TPR) repeat protein